MHILVNNISNVNCLAYCGCPRSEHAVILDVEDDVGFSSVPQMAMYVTNPEFANNDGGAGSSRSEGGQQGSLMDEEWGMSSRSEYASSKTGSSTKDTVSMVDESCEAVGGSSSDGDDAEEVHANSAEGSGKGKSQKRRREPTVEGRRWRQKAAGDGFMFDKEGRGVVPVSMRGRCTLEKIYKFDKTLEPHQKEAIEGTMLKPIPEYHPFSMQREFHFRATPEDGDPRNKTKGFLVVAVEVVRLVKEPSRIMTTDTYVCKYDHICPRN
ncbi:hypothetical protein Cgig2_011342 [Carnegiea gigantea]|uniref:Uncharacterized protein n=1 Tax=Carnegiea gigantea TaxID=171969 RepID=A0A9Q1JTR2_9CARY|nr:hypothetical protein Cgig2_011342 [Carnegiea gigantea]